MRTFISIFSAQARASGRAKQASPRRDRAVIPDGFPNSFVPDKIPVAMPTFVASIKLQAGGGRALKSKTVIGVDTGATNTFMPAKLFDQMRKRFPSAKVLRATTLTASGQTIVNVMLGINVCVDGCCAKTNISFLPADIPTPLNLGMDFLSQSGSKLDMKTCTLKCGSKTIPMHCPTYK